MAATIDARPGGTLEMHMPGGMVASGRFVDVAPNLRVVFTWGWTLSPAVPPGSSTVEVDLVPDGEGTIIRLTHRGLPPDELAPHGDGWTRYLGRPASLVEGQDPGPDPGPGGRPG